MQCSSGWTSIKHNQTSKWFRMQRHDWSSTSPKEPMLHLSLCLHWLPVAARIQFKTLMLAYRTITGSAPTYFHSITNLHPLQKPAYFHSLLQIYIPSRSPAYFHSLLRIYIPSRSLRSASERRLVVPSQRGSKSLSRTFSFTVPGCWNDPPPNHPPPPIQNAESLSIFKQQLKTHLFQLYLTSS